LNVGCLSILILKIFPQIVEACHGRQEHAESFSRASWRLKKGIFPLNNSIGHQFHKVSLNIVGFVRKIYRYFIIDLNKMTFINFLPDHWNLLIDFKRRKKDELVAVFS
jgi:hypothetical protein